MQAQALENSFVRSLTLDTLMVEKTIEENSGE
jgi:hypothetical protein